MQEAMSMPVTVRLTPEEEARLEALAQRTGRSKTFYVRMAIKTHLDELEDAYAADNAMKEFEAGGGQSRPLTELVAEMGLTDEDIAEGRRLNEDDAS